MEDPLHHLAESMGIQIKPRTVFVEGDSDMDLFKLAAHLEKQATGIDLQDGLAIVSAGTGDEGGVRGVINKLLSFSTMGNGVLLPNGNRKYRFIALLDNDDAGRRGVKTIRSLNPGLRAFKDVFILRPVFPITDNLDPDALERAFDQANQEWKGLDWELEDLVVPTVIDAFTHENPGAIKKKISMGTKQHTEFHEYAKGTFNKFVRDHAMRSDIEEIVMVLKALRRYLRLP